MLLALVVMACVWGASIFIGTYWLKTPGVLISLLVNRQSESNATDIIVNGTVVVHSVMPGDGNYRWSVNQDLSDKTYLLIQGADMFKKSFWIALCFLLLSHTSFAQEITSGYVMTHEHPTYGMAFGGNYAFAGAEDNYKHGIMEKGYTAECGGCKVGGKCDHGEVKGSAVDFFGGLGKDMGLHGSHMGPLHNSFSHLRYSTEWIKDASIQSETESEDSRMRIMVAYAVENEAMCEQLYYVNKGAGGAGGDGFSCSKGDSWDSLKRQLDNIKEWAQANKDWVEIAYTADEARRIINNNRLAVMLGIESEYAFGAEARKFDPVERLNKYYDEGVRTFYLAHKINSRLSGADIFMPQSTAGGRAIRTSQALAGCFYYDDNVGNFPLQGRLGENLCDNTNQCGANAFKGGKITDQCSYKLSDISEINFLDYLSRGAGAFDGFSLYPLPPSFKKDAVHFDEENHGGSHMDGEIERNNLGLSHDGERVVREAMTKGMLITIDHTSSVARKQIHQLAVRDFKGYPLNALHNKPNSRLTNEKDYKRHEYDFDQGELDFVKETGGFFGVRMGPTDSVEYNKSGITTNCSNTSTETAKILAWLIDQGLSVGYALDFSTITEAVHSRTFTGCGLELGTDQINMYGRHEAQGLSHIGMMKQWHRELKTIGLQQNYLDTLKNKGVEQFLKMWKMSERKASEGRQIPRVVFASEDVQKGCKEDSDCADKEYCARMGADVRTNTCKMRLSHGAVCTDKRQCASDRCSWGICANPDECQADKDCISGQYCGNPVAGIRSCKMLLAHGAVCTDKGQCASDRCSWGICADPDECRADGDCDEGKFCGDPISGKRTCKTMQSQGQVCTRAEQCDTKRCSLGFCAAADDCRSNADCRANQYCGDPVSGKRKCKDLLSKGKACTKDMQCSSDKCSFFFCK